MLDQARKKIFGKGSNVWLLCLNKDKEILNLENNMTAKCKDYNKIGICMKKNIKRLLNKY
jgi:hypothetical protein